MQSKGASLTIDDPAKTIELIKKYFPQDQDHLIKVTEKLVKKALEPDVREKTSSALMSRLAKPAAR